MSKKHAPATLRNREAILGVLRQELPERGTVLEVASGSGEHAVYFAEHMPGLAWQPSDPDPEALASIAAYRAEYEGVNLREPVKLDASAPTTWNVREADAVVCINMVHISPWEATEGLFAGSAQALRVSGGPLILYGPYFEEDVETAPSNMAFDESLRSRDPAWGLREVAAMDALAQRHRMARTARHAMPANNLVLVYRTGTRSRSVNGAFASGADRFDVFANALNRVAGRGGKRKRSKGESNQCLTNHSVFPF